MELHLSYGEMACHMGSQLPATRHKWTHPALIPARQSGILSHYYWTVDNANLLRFARRSYHL